MQILSKCALPHILHTSTKLFDRFFFWVKNWLRQLKSRISGDRVLYKCPYSFQFFLRCLCFDFGNCMSFLGWTVAHVTYIVWFICLLTNEIANMALDLDHKIKQTKKQTKQNKKRCRSNIGKKEYSDCLKINSLILCQRDDLGICHHPYLALFGPFWHNWSR